MNIHQLSVRYQPEQDRILLSLNTTTGQTLDIWLTRRLTLALWPQLNQMVISHVANPEDAKSDGFVNLAAMDAHTRTVLADFRRQVVLQTMDFSTPFQANQQASLTGGAPLLATEITLSPQPGQKVQVQFKEQISPTAAVRDIRLDLQATLVFSLVQMLGMALPNTQWQMAATGLALTDADGLTPGLSTERPSYLN